MNQVWDISEKRQLALGLDLIVLHEATYDYSFAVGCDHHRLGGACGKNRQFKPFRNDDFSSVLSEISR